MGTDLNNRVIPLSNTNSDKTIYFPWGSIAAEIVVQENPSGLVIDEFSVLWLIYDEKLFLSNLHKLEIKKWSDLIASLLPSFGAQELCY